jgi:hypothetical protein
MPDFILTQLSVWVIAAGLTGRTKGGGVDLGAPPPSLPCEVGSWGEVSESRRW